MSEIAKLRQRLLRVNKNVVEYRMTIDEARSLITEIDEALKPKEPVEIIVTSTPDILHRVIDSGNF
jgi:hypothetical protein